MDSIELLKSTTRAITAHKRRSVLTMLGIVIGIAAVIMIMSVGEGAQSLLQNQIASIGSNLVVVLPGASDDDGPPASVFGISVTTLKRDDIEAVEREVPEIIAASGYIRGQFSVVYQNQTIDSPFVAVEHDYPIVEDTGVVEGRFFAADEDRGISRVAVLGHQVADELFADADPIGERIRIGKESFTVIGVMEERGVEAFENQDRLIFIPLETGQKLMLGVDHLALSRMRVQDDADLAAVSEQVRSVLRERHDITNPENDDFSVRNASQALDLLGNLTGVLSLFLAAIGAISLVVGGVGIMNIMLVSVNERIAEIGLRKSIGARKKDIKLQFILEALGLTFVGALIGIGIGAFLAWIVAVVAQAQDFAWDYSVPIWSVILSCVMAFIIGLAFGYYPARKASELDPIDALRYE